VRKQPSSCYATITYRIYRKDGTWRQRQKTAPRKSEPASGNIGGCPRIFDLQSKEFPPSLVKEVGNYAPEIPELSGLAGSSFSEAVGKGFGTG
jgi:hypothetical protein